MISKLRGLFGKCSDCVKYVKLVEQVQSDLNSQKNSAIIRGKIYDKEVEVLKKELADIKIVRDNLIGERKDFSTDLRVLEGRLQEEKDLHKLTRDELLSYKIVTLDEKDNWQPTKQDMVEYEKQAKEAAEKMEEDITSNLTLGEVLGKYDLKVIAKKEPVVADKAGQVSKKEWDNSWVKTSPELSAILDEKYGLKKTKKESRKNVAFRKKDSVR